MAKITSASEDAGRTDAVGKIAELEKRILFLEAVVLGCLEQIDEIYFSTKAWKNAKFPMPESLHAHSSHDIKRRLKTHITVKL